MRDNQSSRSTIPELLLEHCQLSDFDCCAPAKRCVAPSTVRVRRWEQSSGALVQNNTSLLQQDTAKISEDTPKNRRVQTHRHTSALVQACDLWTNGAPAVEVWNSKCAEGRCGADFYVRSRTLSLLSEARHSMFRVEWRLDNECDQRELTYVINQPCPCVCRARLSRSRLRLILNSRSRSENEDEMPSPPPPPPLLSAFDRTTRSQTHASVALSLVPWFSSDPSC